jgi:glycosyltransferase involved in cell wall biosynthesis
LKFQFQRINNRLKKIGLYSERVARLTDRITIYKKEITKVDPDLLVSYMNYPIQKSQSKRIPVFHTAGLMSDSFIKTKYDTNDIQPFRQEQIQTEVQKLNEIDVYHSHTHTSTKLCETVFPSNKCKFVTIPFFLPNIAPINNDAFDLKWSQKTRKCIFIGNQAKLKNLELLIKAWNEVVRDHPEYTLIIISNFADGPLPIKQTDRLIVKSNVPNAEVLKELETSHFFLLPSKKDSFGISFIEAMSKGCVLFGASIEVQEELISNNGCGLVYDYENDTDIFLKLKNLLFEVDAKKMASKSLNTFKDQFAPEVVANRFFQTWKSMLVNNE